MKQYHDHLKAVIDRGTRKSAAREGMPGSLSLFGYQNRYQLSEGFPILTTKKINFNNIVTELLWFLKGDTNIKYLVDNGCNIWNEDAYNYYKKKAFVKDVCFEDFIEMIKSNDLRGIKDPNGYEIGDCGKQYGWLWRKWQGVTDPLEEGESVEYDLNESFEIAHTIDQIKDIIEGLKSNPMGRRHIISAWNPATLDDMALNACHAFVQFNCREIDLHDLTLFIDEGHPEFKDPYGVTPKYYLDCQLYQRSADMFLGVPYNIASYALLTEIIAKVCNMIPGEFIHTFGDSHIYNNHEEQVAEILSRDINKYPLPKLIIQDDCTDIDRLFEDMFYLSGYQSYPTIKAKLSTGLK